jgi:DNA gyrase subunit A
VIAMVSNERNGRLVGAVQVLDGEEIMLISDQGTLVRTRVDEVSSLGRNTQGVTLIKLAKDETLVGLERFRSRRKSKAKSLKVKRCRVRRRVVIDDVDEDQQLDAAADEEPQE